MDQYTVQHVHIWGRPPRKRETAQKTSKPNPQTKNKTNQNKHKGHRHEDMRALVKLDSLCADELDLAKLKNTLRTSQQDRDEGAKTTKTNQRRGNPGSPQPGSRRSRREAHGA